MNTLEQLVKKSKHAAHGGFSSLSTGEKLAVAMILNHSDWLRSMNYTIAEAVERIGPEWLQLIPIAAKEVVQESAALRQMEQAAKVDSFIAEGEEDADEEVHLQASLVTYGHAPGYRNVLLIFDVKHTGSPKQYRLCLHIGTKDGETIMRHITEVHRHAWKGGLPLDLQPGEQSPQWCA